MANNEWATPCWLIERLIDAVDGFDLDPCSGAEPVPIADTRYTVAEDGLAQDWHGKVWVNPPYERYVIDEWAEKIHTEATSDRTDLVIALVPVRANSDWWHHMADNADYVYLLGNRIAFEGAQSTGRYPYSIILYGDHIPDRVFEVIEMDDPDHRWYGAQLYKAHNIRFLESTGVHETLTIELDDRSPGFPAGVSVTKDAVVQSARVQDGLVEIMAIEPGLPETWHLLSFPTNDKTDIRCSVEQMNGTDWAQVPVRTITPRGDGTNRDPFTHVA